MRSVKSVLLLALVVTACSNTLSPALIAGKWVQDFIVPGSSLEMDLTYESGAISGTGSWCAEAGPCGTLAIAGTINGSAVHLDLTFTPTLPPGGPEPGVEHFDGGFSSPRSLKGTLTFVRPGQPPVVLGEIGYHRE